MARFPAIRRKGTINTEGMIIPSAAGDFNNLVVFVDLLDGASSIELKEVKPLELS